MSGRGSMNMKKSVRYGRNKIRENWDTLLWIIVMFATLYLTEFMSNILLNPLIHRGWQAISVTSLSVACVCVYKIAKRSPRLELTDWDSTWPPTIGFITGTLGIISFSVSVWSIWRYWTLLIVPILFMGFISIVSMM